MLIIVWYNTIYKFIGTKGNLKMLRLENISWSTPDGVKILDGLSLSVKDNELTVITGPNGGGKTTLAKIIAGIEKPTSGRIYLDDIDITDKDVTERAKMGVSFAFQQPVRFKGITVRRLLELAHGGKMPEDEICNVLSRVGLCAREYTEREVNATLSGGEIKRIEIASVLARHTKLSIFDEPEAGIDLWSFTNLIKAFEQIRTTLEGTLMIISHQERILNIADTIVVVGGGTVQRTGSPAELNDELFGGRFTTASCRKQEALFQ